MKKGSALILSIVAAVAVIGLAFVLTNPIQNPTGAIPGSGQIIPSFKVAICHKGTTLFVAPGAVPGHQSHGDSFGACGVPTPTTPPITPTETPSVEPTETPLPTDTPEATPTNTPNPTDTPVQTPTDTPEQPTPTDTFTPNPTGNPF